MTKEIEDYIYRTGANMQDVLSGLSAFGIERIIKLVKKANEDNKKLVFFYESDKDMEEDRPYYKFE